jgi:hypothetical protein
MLTMLTIGVILAVLFVLPLFGQPERPVARY